MIGRREKRVHIISTVWTDVTVFPLRLSYPNGINNGGYIIPDKQEGYKQEYSSIDTLIAGLEAVCQDIIVYDLSKFFYDNPHPLSAFEVRITIMDRRIERPFMHISIAKLQQMIAVNNDKELLELMRKNAPLSFRNVHA